MNDSASQASPRAFYERQYQGCGYANYEAAESHPGFQDVVEFVQQRNLAAGRCLEVGCGRGVLQELVADYVGLDLAVRAGANIRKPFVAGSALALPFRDGTFDGVWSFHVLEHVMDPELALREIRRVLKPGGWLLLAPAWHCRPWAASGIAVRRYSDLRWNEKVTKASLILRERLLWRAAASLPGRLRRFAMWCRNGRATPLAYRRLRPNYRDFIQADSDACVALDPFDAWLWFVSRGDRCASHPNLHTALLARHGALILRKAQDDPVDTGG